MQAQQHPNFSFREFMGVNTRDQRWAIEDGQFSWMEGLVPIGKGNLSVVPAPSSSIYTLPAGITCTRMSGANLNGTEYTFMFGSDGSAYQIKNSASPSITANFAPVSGVIDGVNAAFDLVGNAGQAVMSLIGTTSIYKTDWQGRQLQYATPRTNLLTYSQTFDNAAWTKNQCAATADSATAPDSTLTAETITTSVGATDTYVTQTNSLNSLAGQTITFSVYVKKGTIAAGTGFVVWLRDGANNNVAYTSFNVSTGAVVTNVLGTYSTQSMGNGWYRWSVTGTFPAGAAVGWRCVIDPFPTPVSGENYFLWGAQMEASSGPTSYIPTTSAPATVTDYVLTSPAHVVFSVPPLSGSSVTWSGNYYTGDATTYVQIAPATQFTPGGTHTAQWNNSTLLIIDTAKGFYSWNGTTLVKLSAIFTFTGRIDSGTIGVAGNTLTVSSSNGTLAVGQIISGIGIAANTTITAVVVAGSIYTVSGAAQSVASETMTATPTAPSAGSVISVFSGRVWIASGRTVTYSAPNSYTDFTTANASGSFVMTDPSLRSNIFSMISANSYLYIFGLTSVNVISDVRVSSGTTLFSNTNVSTSSGTDMIDGVVSYYRTIMFASDYGIFGLTGSTARSESSDLDGTFPLIDLTKPITGGVAAVFEKLCIFFLFQYKDPALSTTRPLIAGFLDGKWFFITPPANATLCCSGIVNDIPSLMITDGSSLFRQFDQTGVAVSHKIQTKLFDMGDPLVDKQAIKFGVERVAPAAISAMNITIDTESGSNPYTSIASNVMIWTNNSGGIINWINNAGLPIIWLSAGYIFSKMSVESPGGITASRKYLGATVSATTAGGVYSGMHFQFEPRATW